MPPQQATSTPQGKKLLHQVRNSLRIKHYPSRTEQTYVEWIKRFILFHGKRHPKEMGGPEIEAFITHLAVERHVATATQNQALSAILFLYRYVLKKELACRPRWCARVVRSACQRFSSAGHLASYSGLTGGLDQSGTHLVQKGITKEGRKELRWAMVEVAQRAVKSDPHWTHKFQELHKRMHRNQAIVAIVVVYWSWSGMC